MEAHKTIISGKALSVIIFIFFFLLTIFSECFLFLSLESNEKNYFSLRAKEIAKSINETINTYGDLTYSVRGLFDASQSVERNEFRDYINSIRLIDRNPGISSISYIEKVLYDNRENFSTLMINDTSTNPLGYPNFKINPDIKKNEYYLGKYVEPEKGRSQSFGYDLSSDVNRLEAITVACDTDFPVSTPVLNLVTTQKPGFSIFLPVYAKQVSLTTIENRRAALVGLIMATIRVDDFFKNLTTSFNDLEKKYIFEAYSVEKNGQEILFYTYNPNNIDFINNYSTKIDVDVSGRVWRLAIYDYDSSVLNNSEKLMVAGGMIGGLLISFLISFLVYLLIQGNNNSIELAKKITNDLKLKEEALLTRTAELEKLNKNMVGRELKMMELKEEITKFKNKLP